MNYITYYLATLIPLSMLDAVWILWLAKGFYAREMGFLFTKTPNLTPAAFFYIIYAFVVLVIIVMPAVSAGSWSQALIHGALFGLAAYGAYDLTNHVTIAGWPLAMTIVDMSWGATVTALSSTVAYFAITALK